MGMSLKYDKLSKRRLQERERQRNYTSIASTKPPIMFKPAKDTESSSMLTYIRQQKTSRGKRVKITLPKLKEP